MLICGINVIAVSDVIDIECTWKYKRSSHGNNDRCTHHFICLDYLVIFDIEKKYKLERKENLRKN